MPHNTTPIHSRNFVQNITTTNIYSSIVVRRKTPLRNVKNRTTTVDWQLSLTRYPLQRYITKFKFLTHLKLCLAAVIHNLKWPKITHVIHLQILMFKHTAPCNFVKSMEIFRCKNISKRLTGIPNRKDKDLLIIPLFTNNFGFEEALCLKRILLLLTAWHVNIIHGELLSYNIVYTLCTQTVNIMRGCGVYNIDHADKPRIPTWDYK